VYGPGFRNVDLSITKNTPAGGKQRVQLRLEIFNLFNTANYGQPGRIVTVGSTSFGVITNTRFPTGDSGSARQVQVAPQYLFLSNTGVRQDRPPEGTGTATKMRSSCPFAFSTPRDGRASTAARLTPLDARRIPVSCFGRQSSSLTSRRHHAADPSSQGAPDPRDGSAATHRVRSGGNCQRHDHRHD